jgi:hypothetical protein
VLPSAAEGLVEEANAAFEASKARLAAGDFAGYGEELARLERALETLAGLAEKIPQ